MQLLTLFVNCRRDDSFHHLEVGDDSLVGQWRFCSLHRSNQLPSNLIFYVSQGLIPYDVTEPRHGALVSCPTNHSVDGCGDWQDIEGKKDMLMQILSELRRR